MPPRERKRKKKKKKEKKEEEQGRQRAPKKPKKNKKSRRPRSSGAAFPRKPSDDAKHCSPIGTLPSASYRISPALQHSPRSRGVKIF